MCNLEAMASLRPESAQVRGARRPCAQTRLATQSMRAFGRLALA